MIVAYSGGYDIYDNTAGFTHSLGKLQCTIDNGTMLQHFAHGILNS